MATRGFLGGLARATAEVALLPIPTGKRKLSSPYWNCAKADGVGLSGNIVNVGQHREQVALFRNGSQIVEGHSVRKPLRILVAGEWCTIGTVYAPKNKVPAKVRRATTPIAAPSAASED